MRTSSSPTAALHRRSRSEPLFWRRRQPEVRKGARGSAMSVVLGVDEVGRGCWAGPLVAGAVLLDPVRPIDGLDDSKKLSRQRREFLAGEIQQHAIAYGLGWVDAITVDKLGITTAVKMAMEQAVAAIVQPYDQIIIDGNYNFLPQLPRVCVLPKADALVPAVSAASIIAKVARDAYMRDAAVQFPQYGFESHVGYGTARHLQALQAHGLCVLHRRSFRPVHAVAGGVV